MEVEATPANGRHPFLPSSTPVACIGEGVGSQAEAGVRKKYRAELVPAGGTLSTLALIITCSR